MARARRGDRQRRPGVLPNPAVHYEREGSRIPEAVRISFTDGTTAVYHLRTPETKRVVMTCISIIRKWNREGK